MDTSISMGRKNFTTLHTSADALTLDGEAVLRVVKADRLMDFDINSYARLLGSDFHNGTIEVDVCSRLLPDAPELARGFIGIAFRIGENDDRFESFYLRPTNGRCDDPVRRKHAVQYFSYPTYTFAWFREHGVTQYEAPADIGLGEWNHIRAEIEEDHAAFFVNEQPVLTVSDLKLGKAARGAVGFFVDVGTEGFFKNLRIACKD